MKASFRAVLCYYITLELDCPFRNWLFRNWNVNSLPRTINQLHWFPNLTLLFMPLSISIAVYVNSPLTYKSFWRSIADHSTRNNQLSGSRECANCLCTVLLMHLVKCCLFSPGNERWSGSLTEMKIFDSRKTFFGNSFIRFISICNSFSTFSFRNSQSTKIMHREVMMLQIHLIHILKTQKKKNIYGLSHSN